MRVLNPKLFKLLLGCLLPFLVLFGCDNNSTKKSAVEISTDCSFYQPKLPGTKMDDLIEVKPSELPKFNFNNLKITNEQRKLTANAAREVINVVAGLKTMSETDSILGKGSYSYPKNPDIPILSFNYSSSTRRYETPQKPTAAFEVDNSFPFQSLWAYFSRTSEDAPWCKGGIGLERNETTNYHTEFSEEFFSEFLNLQLVGQTFNKIHMYKDLPEDIDVFVKYPDVDKYAEYKYKLRGTKDVFVSFYVHFADYNEKKNFPKNFNSMVVHRGVEKVSLNSSDEKATVKIGEKCTKTGFWNCPQLEKECTLFMRKGDIMPGLSYKMYGYDVDNMYWEFVKDA